MRSGLELLWRFKQRRSGPNVLFARSVRALGGATLHVDQIRTRPAAGMSVIQSESLLLDEPLGALDRKLRENLQVELKQLERKLGPTTPLVTPRPAGGALDRRAGDTHAWFLYRNRLHSKTLKTKIERSGHEATGG
jgi:ABC-type thiamine transport system ATPase subunit